MNIGNVKIGKGEKIAIQSMCNTDTRDVKSTVAQILELEAEGAHIIRVAVPDMEAAAAFISLWFVTSILITALQLKVQKTEQIKYA